MLLYNNFKLGWFHSGCFLSQCEVVTLENALCSVVGDAEQPIDLLTVIITGQVLFVRITAVGAEHRKVLVVRTLEFNSNAASSYRRSPFQFI